MRVRMSRGSVMGRMGGVLIMMVAAAPPQDARAQGDHAGQYAQADIEYGLRIYRTTCAACHAENGAGVPGVDISRATPRAQTDLELMGVILAGIPGTAMPPGEYSEAELTALVAYVRTMNELDTRDVQLGDAARGEAIVRGKGECTQCHRVQPTGPLGMAPDLADIGARRTAGALEATLLDPTGTMIPINKPVRVVLPDDTVVNGRRLNEDTHTVQLIDEHGRLHSLDKATLREFTVLQESPMPSYSETLSTQEIADVVAYLLTLRGAEGLE